jgi:hypothetical protein
MPPDIGDELIERRPAVLRAADALIDVLDGSPAACCHVLPQLKQLVLGRLVVRAHARVDSDLHLVLAAEGLLALLLTVFAFATETPFFCSHARNARSTWTEKGTPSRSFTRRKPSMIAGSIRNAVISFGMSYCINMSIHLVKYIWSVWHRRASRAGPVAPRQRSDFVAAHGLCGC